MAKAINTITLYSDCRTDFDIHPVTGDLAKLTNEEAVKRSVRNICLTGIYERFWNPRFGAGLSKYLFEPISYITEDLIKNAIKDAIANYEPRALTYEVYVSAQPDQNAYAATIIFTVINNPNAITFSVLLNRIR
jgi:phage baseplate assembly protein W